MSVIVDTGVLYGDHDKNATRHAVADGALDAIYDGVYGQPYVSDYIYDETITLTLRRSGSYPVAKRIGERMRGAGEFPPAYELQHITPTSFEQAIDVFERYDDQRLSFTDATTVALVRHHDIDHVLSFDDDFDGLVGRLSPKMVTTEHNS